MLVSARKACCALFSPFSVTTLWCSITGISSDQTQQEQKAQSSPPLFPSLSFFTFPKLIFTLKSLWSDCNKDCFSVPWTGLVSGSSALGQILNSSLRQDTCDLKRLLCPPQQRTGTSKGLSWPGSRVLHFHCTVCLPKYYSSPFSRRSKGHPSPCLA